MIEDCVGVCRSYVVLTSISSLSDLLFGSNEALGVLQSRAHVMTGKIRTCCRGFQNSVVACVDQQVQEGNGDSVLWQPWTTPKCRTVGR